jgi:hypothetical protein
MFECLSFVAGTDLNFFYNDATDEAALLPQKRELLSIFLSIDPQGAGGEAREYWTCWGVTING